jgi:hypothetical protein
LFKLRKVGRRAVTLLGLDREHAEAFDRESQRRRSSSDPDLLSPGYYLLMGAAGAAKAETLNPCQRAVAGKTAKGSHEVAR